jgi:predicted DNA-binding transcriptional regulator YafY
MSRGEVLFRQWELIRTLQSHHYGICIEELAQRLECTRRTVQRDLEAMKSLFPLSFEEREFGKKYWKLSADFIETGQLRLSLSEMLSLYLSRELLAPLSGTPFGDGFSTALEKIKTLLPTEALSYFADLDESFLIKSMGSEDYTRMKDEVATLNEAILHNRIVRIGYHSASQDRSVRTEMHPYGMVLLSASLYCIGYLAEYDEVRTLKISRFQSVEPTGRTFEKPESFSLRRYTGGSFGIFGRSDEQEIVVQFSDWAAINVREHRWHDSQEILADEDGQLRARFVLANTVEFKRWLLGFGAHAVVESPRKLAEEVARELRQALEGYTAGRG